MKTIDNCIEPGSRIVVSVLIPVHDDAVGLETTLRSLTNLDHQHLSIEIIICNDGGGGPISSLAKQYNCLEAQLKTNSGSYAARNAGLAMARGKYIAFLDADQRVDAKWIKAGINALTTADYVGGKIVVEAGDHPDIWERYDQLNAFPVEHYLRVENFAPTANLFVRRKVFDVVGHFEERLRSNGDGEFGRRVHQAGFAQCYAADAITFHGARNRRKQLRKLRRVGSGVAEVQIRIYGENPFEVISSSFRILRKSVKEIFKAVIKHILTRSEKENSDAFYLTLIDKLHSGLFFYWKMIWALKWVQKHRSRVFRKSNNSSRH